MVQFETRCPLCNKFADVFTEDSRNRVICYSCGYKDTFKNALRLRNKKREKENSDGSAQSRLKI